GESAQRLVRRRDTRTGHAHTGGQDLLRGSDRNQSLTQARDLAERCACSVRGGRRERRPQSTLTARATISPIVTTETSDCTPISTLDMGESGIVSVGEKAVALVSDTYR